jgi:hypothetical protein
MRLSVSGADELMEGKNLLLGVGLGQFSSRAAILTSGSGTSVNLPRFLVDTSTYYERFMKLPPSAADCVTRRRLTKKQEQETIINRSDRSTYPEEKSVQTSGAIPNCLHCSRRHETLLSGPMHRRRQVVPPSNSPTFSHWWQVRHGRPDWVQMKLSFRQIRPPIAHLRIVPCWRRRLEQFVYFSV